MLPVPLSVSSGPVSPAVCPEAVMANLTSRILPPFMSMLLVPIILWANKCVLIVKRHSLWIIEDAFQHWERKKAERYVNRKF